MKKKHLFFSLGFIVLLIVFITNHYINNKNIDMVYTEFLDEVNQSQVQKVILQDNANTFLVILNSDDHINYRVLHPKSEGFIEFLLLNNIVVEYGTYDYTGNLFQIVIVAILGFGFIMFIRNRNGDNKMIADVNTHNENKEKMTFEHVAGNIEAKAMVMDIIHFIKQPEKYNKVGAKMPRGIMLYGPPGTGKTLMAKAIAGEADVPFYAMSGSDFVQMYVGVGASRVRSLFKKAKKSEKAVIFIDEIDALGKKRSRNVSASNDERDQTLNALLSEMSGFNENDGIIVIAATNRLDTLDEALLRPGRFDRQIEIGLPDVNSRKKILNLYAKDKPISDDVDMDNLAKSTVLFSGAMLEGLLNEAAIFAANENMSVINNSHIDKAFYTSLAGAQKQDRSYISDYDKKITAYHEAGHALATTKLLPEQFISKVTIIPSVRGTGGFNLTIPKDTLYQTQKQIRANIQILLAGRAAEELIFGQSEVTTGASNDIQKASELMINYINKFGMDKEFGLFNTDIIENYCDNKLVEKCRKQINIIYEDTKELLQENINFLENITTKLLEKESISGEDIIKLCA